VKVLGTRLLFLSVLLVFSWPVVAQSHPTPPPKPIPFVQGQPPEGKALIYFFSSVPTAAQDGWALFSQTGPVAVLPTHGYHVYVAEPGNLKFFAISLGGGAVVCRVDATAGGIYYVKMSMGFNNLGLAQVPNDQALKELQTGYTSVD